MKISKWIVYVLITLIAMIIISPVIMSPIIEKQYRKKIESYNLTKLLDIEIKSYHRGWLSSDAVLSVRLKTKEINSNLKLPANFNFIINQHIKHRLFGLMVVRSTFAIVINHYLFSVTGAVSEGNIKKGENKLSVRQEISVDELQLNDEMLGSLRLIFSAANLDSKALDDVLLACREFIFEGELYQGQLKNKLQMLIPDTFNPGATLSLDALSVKTPKGSLEAVGKITWPMTKHSTPDDLEDFIHGTSFTVSLRVSQALVDELIKYAATLSYFNNFSSDERKELSALEDDINVSFQQNNLLLAGLIHSRAISESAGEYLLFLLQDHTLSDHYITNIKTLFLNKDISLETAYLLYWQFSQLQRAVALIEKQLKRHEEDAQEELSLWLEDLIEKGYISKSHHDYVMVIMRENGILKSNGKVLKD